MQGNIVFAEIKQHAWNVQKLRALGVDERRLAEAHPTEEQIRDLFKGFLYLRELYPEFWDESRANQGIFLP
jgi:hypothetical protein